MNTSILKIEGIQPMLETEILETTGGCGSWWWCAERIAFELDKAGEAFVEAFNEGWQDYDIH